MNHMGFSMDGLRTNMVCDLNQLKNSIDLIIDQISIEDSEKIKQSFNDLAQDVGFLCCTFNKDVHDYADLSDYSERICIYEDDEDDEEEL